MFKTLLKWYPISDNVEQFTTTIHRNKKIVYSGIHGKFIITQHNDNEYVAFKNKCPHQGKPLDHCSITEGMIVCPYHRYGFSIENGRGHGLYLKQYPVKIENGQVYIGKQKWSLF